MNQEARPFGVEINWDKTRIQTTTDLSAADLQQSNVVYNSR